MANPLLWLASVALLTTTAAASTTIPISDPNIAFSPYNWFKSGTSYAQSPNPGAYLKAGFSGSSVTIDLDVSPLSAVPAAQYPMVRWSVDGGPPVTAQLTPTTTVLSCGKNLKGDRHTLLLQYVAGYVFLDFWSPVNVLRVTGFILDDGASSFAPITRSRTALFLGDSITNGDDDIATFSGGVTNAVDTQDATVGYPSVVAAGIGAEYGVVAYGGASWDRNAADGHTPGLMTFYSMLDRTHPRSFSPPPDDIFINMGENVPPSGDEVPQLLGSLRAAVGSKTNIFVLVPFSGRAREQLTSGVAAYRSKARSDKRVFLIDLGNEPYLTDAGPTMLSVDGQHPLAALHALLGAKIVAERARLLGDQK